MNTSSIPRHAPSPLLAGLALLLMGAAVTLLPPWLSLFIAAGTAGLTLLALKPHWFLIILLLARSSVDGFKDALSFFPGAWYSFNLAGLFNILGVGLAVFFLARRFARGQSLLPAASLKTYALFLLVALASTVTSIDPAASVKEWSRFAGALGVALLAIEIAADERAGRSVVTAILLASLPPLVVGFYQAAGGSGRFFPGYQGTLFAYRPSGTFDHPATLASFLIVVICLALAPRVMSDELRVMSDEPGNPRRSSLITHHSSLITIPCLALLVLTYARTEWLGAAVALGVIGWLRYKRLLFLGMGVVTLVWLVSPAVRERLTGGQAGESWAWRQEVWGASLDILESPTLLGSGPDTSPILLNWRLPHVETPPHNDYLKVGIELGLLGWLTYGLWQIALLYQGWRGYRAGRALGLALLAMTAAGLVISLADNYLGFTSVQWYVWTVVGLSVRGK